jgi:hypothetical protein
MSGEPALQREGRRILRQLALEGEGQFMLQAILVGAAWTAVEVGPHLAMGL